MTNRVVLAYSGGLDTSVAIPYLGEMIGGEVVAVRPGEVTAGIWNGTAIAALRYPLS